MTGTLAISGSVAMRLRKVVMARSPSSRSASMLTSSMFAPLRTCSAADVDRSLEVSRLDQLAEPRRPRDVLTLADHHEARVLRDPEGSRPENEVS